MLAQVCCLGWQAVVAVRERVWRWQAAREAVGPKGVAGALGGVSVPLPGGALARLR